jgi:hypothetical protein
MSWFALVDKGSDPFNAQFYKHLVTKILPQLDREAANGAKFIDERVPILEYDLAGSFYAGLSRQQIVDRFNKVISDHDDIFDDIIEAGYRLDLDHVHISSELFHPIVN